MIKKFSAWLYKRYHAIVADKTAEEFARIQMEHSGELKKLRDELKEARARLVFCVNLLDGRCPPEHLHALQKTKEFLK